MNIKAYGAAAANRPVEPLLITRRSVGTHDVAIDIVFCGVCHSDLHTVRGEWAGTRYPCVPGHEIVGRVSAVGAGVTRYQPGDLVGVGCIVGSCGHCPSCSTSLEQYCERGMTGTYNSPVADAPGHTLGGYSQKIVVNEGYVLRVSHDERQLAAVAPLLCAGITMYSPLRHWGAGPGKKVGIVGLGGLGHMGVKLSNALGAHTVAFTTSEAKRSDALTLGAHEVVVSRNGDEMNAHVNSFDFIINTVAASHSLDAYTRLLKLDGSLVLVGAPAEAHPSPNVFGLITRRRSIAGSLIGGIAETQEMLDFCAANGIVADIEMIRADEIESAYARMLRSDVKYRFVIDISTMG